jgi:hypothetical protein
MGKKDSWRRGFGLGDYGPPSGGRSPAKKQSRQDVRFGLDRNFDFFRVFLASREILSERHWALSG